VDSTLKIINENSSNEYRFMDITPWRLQMKVSAEAELCHEDL